jgi:pimeloyl-ACP methyl ester carboxylesterase
MPGDLPYRPQKPSRSLWVEARGLRLHVREWGNPADPPLVLVHGSRDGAMTFQFVVDALQGGLRVLAPDLRGHGQSGWAPGGYAFADFLPDLDAVLERLVPDQPVALGGHSLGGNIVTIYAGARPERVRALISLDGFGLPDRNPADAPDHLARWLAGCRGALPSPARFSALDAMAARLMSANPRLSLSRALFLAEHLSRRDADGLTWAYDPMHRLLFPVLHRRAEWEAALRRITAPVLWIGSGKTFPPSLEDEPGGFAGRVALARAEFHRLDGTGHNLHHDRPELVAALLDRFLASGGRWAA